MRLWTIHPRYLDPRGLVALWREALLAQKVLRGRTVGYREHPQLDRFRAQREPVKAVASYLAAIHKESVRRGYHFDKTKIVRGRSHLKIKETTGQLLYEWKHLQKKLRKRAPTYFKKVAGKVNPIAHPLFKIGPGAVRDWERVR